MDFEQLCLPLRLMDVDARSRLARVLIPCFSSSLWQALSNKQTAQARYRGLKGSIEKLPTGSLVSRILDGSR
jgi:hypothetical protein